MTRSSGLFLITFALAALLLFRAADAFQNSWRARNWSSVDAVVTDSATGWREHQRANYKPVLSYELRVRYAYQVDGRGYSGSRIRFSPWGANENFNPGMSGIVGKYPVGAQVRAHFDPVNPANSVLEPEVLIVDWLFLIAGIAAAVSCVRYLRRVQAEKRALVLTSARAGLP